MAKQANSSGNFSKSNPQMKGMQCSYIAYLIVMQRNTIGRKVRGGWREMWRIEGYNKTCCPKILQTAGTRATEVALS